jgi:hypothetical protein
MKSAAIRPVKYKAQHSVITAKEIDPGEFHTLWGKHFQEFTTELAQIISRIENNKLARAKRIDHVKSLRSRGLTLQNIGDLLGITRERVRQLLVFEPKPY